MQTYWRHFSRKTDQPEKWTLGDHQTLKENVFKSDQEHTFKE